uniref:Uncharacterized protein n=1 Tax=Planktothrix agardhii TaxID=1160 RepID=A0A1J1JIG3_PLAAG|nr:protein of unknown function [Planktothrix agardhii]
MRGLTNINLPLNFVLFPFDADYEPCDFSSPASFNRDWIIPINGIILSSN